MTTIQFDKLYNVLTKVSEKQDSIGSKLDIISKQLNSLPNGSTVLDRLSKILKDMQNDIDSIRDELKI